MWRVTALAVPALLLAFVGLYVGAAVAYPGGTWEQPARVGHSFLFNYYCDLMRPVALNGQPNPVGSVLAELGQLTFALALGPFFQLAPRAFERRRGLSKAVRGLGAVACVAGIGVVLLPSWRFGQGVHGVMLLSCGLPAIAALICVMIGTWSIARLRTLALALAAFLVLTVAIFVRQLLAGTETTLGLAPLQCVDFALALAWMLLTVRAAARLGSPGS
jgi:hypothetical protein